MVDDIAGHRSNARTCKEFLHRSEHSDTPQERNGLSRARFLTKTVENETGLILFGKDNMDRIVTNEFKIETAGMGICRIERYDTNIR